MLSHCKYAFRTLGKSPGFTAIAILIIAVGIGANSALFSAFSQLILSPLNVPHPGSLVTVWSQKSDQTFYGPQISWPRYEEIRDHSRSFSSIAAGVFENFTLTGAGDPDQLNGERVSSGFFQTLGIAPLRGRAFRPEEDVPNGPAVCIISYEFWQTRFGGRESILGESLRLNGQPWEVVGITPPLMSNPFAQTQVFTPRVFDVSVVTPEQVKLGSTIFLGFARLKPGVSVGQASAEMAVLSQEYRRQLGANADATDLINIRPFADAVVGNLRPTFYMMMGAVAFVLLIACANVAGLFLARLSGRRREIAVRQSLGAGRGAVIRQFLAESLVFCSIAGLFGIILARLTLSWVQAIVSAQLGLTISDELDWRVVAFTGAAAVASSVLVGLVPAVQASKLQLIDALKDNARGASGGTRSARFRAFLIVAEVALSVVLLVGSSLLVTAFLKLQRAPFGFRTKGVASAFVGLPPGRYPTHVEQSQFFTQVVEQLRHSPQVKAAAAAIGLPLSGGLPISPYSVAGRPVLPLAQRALASYFLVSDGYFEAFGIPIHAGRSFTPSDRMGSPGVCIVNSTLGHRLFPGESPLGHVLLHGPKLEKAMEIVGVIDDVKTNGVNAPVPDEIYYPMAQSGYPGMSIVASTDGNPDALQAVIRKAVAAVDHDQPISFFQTMDTAVEQSLGTQRIGAALTLIFACIALFLATIGLYSVLAYTVTQRTPEIGIRLALGAQRVQVVGLIMGDGMKLFAVGLACGLAAAAGVARFIQSLPFSVGPLDPMIFGGVALLFSAVAAAACLLPSLRASRINPMESLRAG